MILPGAVGYVGDLQVTLTNSSGRPLTLQPTPTYLIAIELSDGAGSDYQIEHRLPLKPGALVVPAHGTLRLALPDDPIPAAYEKHLRGHQTTVSFVTAGFADAEANTRVTN